MMTSKDLICAVESCPKPSRTPGSAYCDAHYARNHKYGDVEANFSRALDWSKTQYCKQCNRKMRPNKSANNGLIAYHGNGICRKCHADNVRPPETRDRVYFDDDGVICSKCNRYQPYDQFRLNKDMVSGYHPVCRTCGSLWIHNITRDQYDALLIFHNYTCAICNRTEQELGQKLNIDHDHACCPDKNKKRCGNCIRGLLCDNCNHGIGHFNDNPQLLEAAIQFLITTKITIKESTK